MIVRNLITGDPLLLAPEREQRPNIFRQATERCPFCPGNESDTPPEIWRDGTPWRLRVFPNKYPATGQHEIIVETAGHDTSFDRMDPADAEAAVRTYSTRYYSLAGSSGYVAVFKNHGLLVGASIPHPHSQVLATPFVPPRIAREAAAFELGCPLCAIDGEPLIAATEDYRWIAPRGASMGYEQWIVPRRHQPEMGDAAGLAPLLQRAARATQSVADAFNWIFLNFPRQPKGHWYVQVLPRLAIPAGFELGSGSWINTIDPEEAARILGAAARPSAPPAASRR